MATLIDSLVVKLALDSKEFKRGEKDVAQGLDRTRKNADKLGNDISASGKRAAEFFGQMEKAAIRFFSILTVGRGAADFTKFIVGSGANLSRVSKRIGESADSLSRWQGAVRQSGGSAEGLMSTVQGLSQQFTQLKETGDAPIRMLLNQLGVSAADATGKAKPILTLLQDIGKALEGKQWSNADKFNKLASAGFDEGTINLLMRGSRELQALLAAQKAYSDGDAKLAQEADQKWANAKLRIERASESLVIAMLPAIESVITATTKFVETITPGLTAAGEGFAKLDKATGGWAANLAVALATLKIITGAGITGAVTGLATFLGRFSAVAGAGVAGFAAGSWLYDKFIAGTPAADMIGGGVAKVVNAVGLGDRGGQISAGGASRAQRNFNPGNLQYAGQAGAVREPGSGRFAKFGSAAEGVAALAKQLRRYGERGLDTIEEIINTYAPASENNTAAYIGALSGRLGVGASQQLNLNDPATMAALVRGISQHEAGSNWLSNSDVMTGLQMAGYSGGGASSNVTIGEVKVYTQAQDAGGIARDMRRELVRQADTGMR